jgi:predicted glycoside hydrolase/deacetylase ChbG (UPF0249 family)
MKIITNADDLGADRATNDAIFALMREELVTSATILANGAAVPDACGQTADFGRCSFGVHLNLTEFRPLRGPHGLEPLLNSAGEFNGTVRTVRNLGALCPAICQEWCAQIERVQSHGVAISHLDSHHHVHTIPRLLPVLKAVQRKFGIRKVRISRNLYTLEGRPPPSLLVKKALFNWALRRWYATATTDQFTDLEAFCAQQSRITGCSRTVEIMLHPGGAAGPDEARWLGKLAKSDRMFKDKLASYHEI